MVKDLRKFGIERWRIVARGRQSCKRLLWEAEVLGHSVIDDDDIQYLSGKPSL